MTNETKAKGPTARKTVTMKDVASRVGVHHSSVSVVLNGSRSSAGISPATRQRILEAAEELGYRRNGSAHTIRTGRFGNVALLLSPLRSHSYLPMPLLEGLYESFAKADTTISVCLLPDEDLNEVNTLPKILRERMCDGLLIDYNLHIPDLMVESIRRHQIPAVWINSKQAADCVHSDDFEAASQATRHLLELGHRRISYVDFANDPYDPCPHYSAHDRGAGYAAVMTEAGLLPNVWHLKLADSDQIEFGEKLLGAIHRPTAIVCYAGWAIEGISHAASRLGLRVPDDLSVVGFGPEQNNYMCCRMTTMLEPQKEIAQIATQMLLRKIENPLEALEPQAVRFSLVRGETSATYKEPARVSAKAKKLNSRLGTLLNTDANTDLIRPTVS